MDTLIKDIRYSVRVLLKNPAYTVVAVITLALGIGATSAVFSVVNAVLLRPLSYSDPDRLAMVYEARQGQEGNLSVPDFTDYRDQNEVFEEIAAYWGEGFNLAGGDKPELVRGELVTANYFSVLNARPFLGRAFLPEEEKASGGRVVVLSHGLWKRRYGFDRRLLGKTLAINGTSFTVVGIMGADFQPLNRDAELWVTLDVDGSDALRLPTTLPHNDVKVRKLRFLSAIARLKQGVTVDQARADLDTIGRRLEQQYPDTNNNWRAVVFPLHERLVGDIRPALLILLGAVAFVLLIACANVANLMLARTVARQKEMAIRAAFGATPGRVIRQLLTESLLLAIVGGATGLLLACWSIDFLPAMSAGIVPRADSIALDGNVLIFTAIISVLTGLVFGLAPALHVANPHLQHVLKQGRLSGTSGMKRQRVRGLFVISEISLALVLLIGAGLMVKSLLRLQKVNPGFNSENLLTMSIALPKAVYTDEPRQVAFFDRLFERVSSLPGVQAACAADHLPATGEGLMAAFTIEGRPQSAAGEKTYAAYSLVSPDYFSTMGIPLIRGRYFSRRDNKEAPPVMIISEAMARLYFNNEDPIGKHLVLSIGPGATISPEIIGVVGDVKQFGLSANSTAQMYESYLQRPAANMNLIARTSSEPSALASTVMKEVLAVDKDQPVAKVESMDEILYDSVAQPRFVMLLLGVFAGVALILASVGIFGVMAYTVSQRRHEIGIRMALGAQQSDILKLILRQAMTLTLIGMGIGLVIAFVLTRLMSSLLFGLSATDPVTFAITSLLLAAVALLSCYTPAYRATKVDPRVALSSE